MLNQVLSSALFAEELRVTLCNACCRVWLSKQYPFSAQKESKRWMSCGSTWMAVSKELTQIITPQTVRCSGVGMAGGRKNSPSSEPGQAQSPQNFQRKAQGTPHLTPLCTTKFGATALPFGSPALLNPLAHGAAHNSQSSKCQCFIFGQAQCRVHPCMHKRINRRLQSPQAQLQFPLQMYFCYKLWHAAVVCKKWSYSKKWF